MGTLMGAGSGTMWGYFPGTYVHVAGAVVCESCGRERSRRSVSGITPYAVYAEDGFLYLVAADTASSACFSLKLEGPDGVITLPLVFLPDQSPPPIDAEAPMTVLPTPPVGAARADALMRARLPELSQGGDYDVTLVDRCAGVETFLVTLSLEAPPMILTAYDADLGGAPRAWLDGSLLTPDAAQPAGSARPSIPFDYCVGVVEYDALNEELPSDQGWTRTGTGASGDWSLVPGGALRLATTTPNTNYWSKTLALSAPIDRVYVYARVLGKDIPAGAIGAGLDVQGMFRDATNPYVGARVAQRQNRAFFTRLSAAAEVAGSSDLSTGWMDIGGAARRSGEEIGYEAGAAQRMTYLAAGTYGTTGVASADELLVIFGNTVGAPTLEGFFRRVVASGPGRFVRATFLAHAQVSTPQLKLYVAADANTSPVKTVRFLIRYGSGMAAPDAPLTSSESVTLNMTTSNAMYEVPVTLSGLTAGQPFRFSIERDWTHADNQLEATVRLHQVRVGVPA